MTPELAKAILTIAETPMGSEAPPGGDYTDEAMDFLIMFARAIIKRQVCERCGILMTQGHRCGDCGRNI